MRRADHRGLCVARRCAINAQAEAASATNPTISKMKDAMAQGAVNPSWMPRDPTVALSMRPTAVAAWKSAPARTPYIRREDRWHQNEPRDGLGKEERTDARHVPVAREPQMQMNGSRSGDHPGPKQHGTEDKEAKWHR